MTRAREEGALRGRGASWNPANRFDGRDYVVDPGVIDDLPSPPIDDEDADTRPDPRTLYLDDTSKSILSTNDSPDVGIEMSLNPYRGCEHGCLYCYARPTHEYLGMSAGLDFETKIFVKHRAPELLRAALMAPRYTPKVIAFSGVTDPYQPAERRFQITRRCLEVLAEFHHPCGVITKNRLITRDIDLFQRLAAHNAIGTWVSVTTLDLQLNRILEPRSSSPAQRLDAIRQLAAAGIPVGVMCAPVVPGITDHEIPRILQAAREAGASRAGYILMRLPFAVAPLFTQWLEQHFPERKNKVLQHIAAMREGHLNDSRFGHRMRGTGPRAEQIARLFEIARRKYGFAIERAPLNRSAFRRPGPEQLSLC